MNENAKYIAGAVAVVGLSVGAVLYLGKKNRAPAPVEPVAALPAEPPAPVEPAVKHPLPEVSEDQALPALDGSDTAIQGALADLIGKVPAEQLIIPDQLVRHIVVSIDNLSEQKLAERVRPLRRVAGEFTVAGDEDTLTLDPTNYARYQSLVQLLKSTETSKLVATYTRYYPLFQEAYESLGHPPEYFNDRVIEIIDHLLAAPEIREPITLEQPGVLYQFADPKLEALSAGQKAMIRMGPDNALAVKAKLRELRTALAARAAG